MASKDAKYYLERAIIERELGVAATNPKAIAAHEELAQRYDRLLEALLRYGRVRRALARHAAHRWVPN
jgi:CRISPR/Cas system-associated protein Cas7 (RAMP superfamily)